MLTNYEKYRGKCKEFSEQLCTKDATLTLTRGYYHCPIWGKQAHWWCVGADGSIIDPTKDQFPSKGVGDYEIFDGTVNCEVCGQPVQEDEAIWMGRYPTCSNMCARALVGL